MTMNKLYLECFSGISGDMFVASLLDLGADEAYLQEVLMTIPLQGFQVRVSRVKKAGLDACEFNVILDEVHENHDHDMKYLYGHEHHGYGHHGHEHLHHEHRGLADVLEIIAHTEMTERAKMTARRIFTILGEAEAKAHGTTLNQVHFHEVGAVDSIVDIVAAAVCLDNLNIEETIIPILYEGSGTIRCRHGMLPVPVPAVANIVEANHIKLHLTGTKGELVTPTGAAIAAAIRTTECLPERFKIKKIGLGAGKREYEHPGILRAMLIQNEKPTDDERIYKLETNIDDCSGECLGYVMEQLLDAGAKDVSYMPIYMKKNRPAYQLNVICGEKDRMNLETLIFKETTTIGIRRILMERSVLQREMREIETSLGKAKVKVCRMENEERIYPEYDSVSALCKSSGKSFQEVFRKVLSESHEQL